MRWWALLLFLFAVALPTHAHDSVQVAPPAGTVQVRLFDQGAIESLQADPAYLYDHDLRRVPTLWDRFKAWLFRKLAALFGHGTGSFMVENLIYLIIAAGVIVAIIMLQRGRMQGVVHGGPMAAAAQVTEEDIHEMDLEGMIREAEAAGELRRAVRLHYLLVLRRLSERGIIQWAPGHTDHAYMKQIGDPAMRARFARVATLFQWVWYGHADLRMEQYEPARRIFKELEQATAAT